MKKIGKYRIEKRVGRGGMAEVWLGHHPTLNRPVAIKVMLPFLGEAPGFEQRFLQEARLVASLRHPNIVQLYDFDIEDGRPFMVMEYLEGGTLHSYLRHRSIQSPLPLEEAISLFGLIARGLTYAHQQGAVHRDLKPANILLTNSGEPVVSDFGIAKLLHLDGQLSVTNAAIGTPAYMSPEQARGKPVDARSDLYALGLILYEMVTGRLPFKAEHQIGLLSLHMTAPPPDPTRFRPDLPEPVSRVILRALAKDPAERYENGDEMALALYQAMGVTVGLFQNEPKVDRADTRPLGPIHATTVGLIDTLSTPPPISSLPELNHLAQTVATVLAVAGRPLTHIQLADLLGEKDEVVLGGIDDLWQVGLLTLVRDRGAYGIDDSVVVKHLIDGAGPARCTLFHRKLAELYTNQNQTQVDPPHSLRSRIGWHYEMANMEKQAVEAYLESAFLDAEKVEVSEADGGPTWAVGRALNLIRANDTLKLYRAEAALYLALAKVPALGWDHPDVLQLVDETEMYAADGLNPALPLQILLAQWQISLTANHYSRVAHLGREIWSHRLVKNQPELQSAAHLVFGLTLWLGDRLSPAVEHFKRGLSTYQPGVKHLLDPFFMVDVDLLLRIGLAFLLERTGDRHEANNFRQQAATIWQSRHSRHKPTP